MVLVFFQPYIAEDTKTGFRDKRSYERGGPSTKQEQYFYNQLWSSHLTSSLWLGLICLSDSKCSLQTVYLYKVIFSIGQQTACQVNQIRNGINTDCFWYTYPVLSQKLQNCLSSDPAHGHGHTSDCPSLTKQISSQD